MSDGLPISTYLICATHRSGSNLLCQALWHTGMAGYPQEAFSPTRAPHIAAEHGIPYNPEKQLACYSSALLRLRQTPNEVFGAKIMWSQVSWLVERLKADGAWPGPPNATLSEIFHSLFPDLRFLWMRRRDKVRQAISLVKAKQTKIYNSMQAESGAVPGEAAYDFEAIDREVRRLHEDDGCWGSFFVQAEIKAHTIYYEDFIENYDSTIRDILRFLGQVVPDNYQAPQTNYQRQADALNDEWHARYLAEGGNPKPS